MERTVLITTSLCKTAHLGPIASHYEFAPHRIHGEPGRRRVAMKRADEIATELVHAIVQDLNVRAGSEVLLMVNGFGATPLLELHLMYDAALRQLTKHGLEASRGIVGNYVTSLDMAGCSVTITLWNDELTSLWDAPVHTAALRWRM